MKMYFYVLHLWIINKRLRHEQYQGDIINTYIFDITWRIVRDWMLLKDVPEYSFNAELLNCQEYAFGVSFFFFLIKRNISFVYIYIYLYTYM